MGDAHARVKEKGGNPRIEGRQWGDQTFCTAVRGEFESREKFCKQESALAKQRAHET